jgi:hypothetical protein
MPFKSLERLGSETIIVGTYEGVVSPDDFVWVNQQVDATFLDIVNERSPRFTQLVFILDIRQSQITFKTAIEIVRIQRAAKKNPPVANGKLTLILVGGGAMARFFADVRAKLPFGGDSTPMFQTVDDALLAARNIIGSETTSESANEVVPGDKETLDA